MTWATEEEKRRFIRRVEELGNHAKACREFGIHPATGHRWRNAGVANDHADVVNIGRGRARISDEALHQAIKDEIWRFPTLSASGYGALLRQKGFVVSPATIQKLLNKWGLGRISDRLDAVEERKIATGEHLPISSLNALRDQGRMVEAANFRAEYPGQVIAISRFRWARKDALFPYLLLAVDVYSMTVRSMLGDGKTFGAEIRVFQSITEFFRRRLFSRHPERRISDGKTFAEIGGYQFRVVVVEPKPKKMGSAADNLVAYVQNVIRADLLPLLKNIGGQPEEGQARGVLQRWEWDFNVGNRFSGFPNFGATPMERVIDYERAYQP